MNSHMHKTIKKEIQKVEQEAYGLELRYRSTRESEESVETESSVRAVGSKVEIQVEEQAKGEVI